MPVKPRQLPLPLPSAASAARDDFVVTSANRTALDRIEAWPQWPAPVLLLVGPQGSGKSHLASILAAKAGSDRGLEILEDVDRHSPGDEALFHLWNRVVVEGRTLLLTGRTHCQLWPITIPDLRSRLRSAPCVELDPPDDGLLLAVIAKHFADRQLQVEPELIGFIASRIERSLGAVAHIVARIDTEALALGRSVTRPFIASLLESEDAG